MTEHERFRHELLYTSSGWGIMAVMREHLDNRVEKDVHKQLCLMLKEVRDAEAQQAYSR